jgi:hypothetical protein
MEQFHGQRAVGKGRLHIALLGAAVLLATAGCASTEPIWFIATPGYVDSRIAVSEEAVRSEYEAEVARLEAELQDQRRVSEELAGLAAIIEEVDKSNQELRELASAVEARLEMMPTETIQRIIDVLQEHLQEASEQ